MKDQYDDREDTTLEQLVNTSLKKCEVIISWGKKNMIYPEEEQIVALTTVVEKTKDDNNKISISANKAPKKQRVNINNSQ